MFDPARATDEHKAREGWRSAIQCKKTKKKMVEGTGGVSVVTTPEVAPSTTASTEAVRASSHAAAAPAGDEERSGWGSRGPVAKLVNELIDALRPTQQSERRRRAVFQHIAKLVDGCFAGENVLVSVGEGREKR